MNAPDLVYRLTAAAMTPVIAVCDALIAAASWHLARHQAPALVADLERELAELAR